MAKTKANKDSSNDVLTTTDMASRMVSMSDAEQSFKDKNVMLSHALDLMQKNLESKEREVLTLKAQLAQLQTIVPSGALTIIPPSEEEIAIEAQLRLLGQASAVRELSLDEIKKFDLLMKNKYLIKGHLPPSLPAKNRYNENTPKIELLAMATKTINKGKE